MKKYFIIITIICFCFSTEAQNVIAVEHGSSTTFYTRLDTALAHTSDGDNVYLPGGYIQFTGTININKRMNIIGVGYNIDSSNVLGNTIINNNIEIYSSGSGGSITGVYCMSSYNIGINDSVNNYIVRRCYFETMRIGTYNVTSSPVTNISIIETVINSYLYIYDQSGSPKNLYISNCFIGKSTGGNPIAPWYYNDNMLNCYGLYCKNSILVGNSTNVNFFGTIYNSTYENCIFIDFNPSTVIAVSYNYLTFKNCIFNKPTTYITGFPANQLFNCIFNQNKDSIFVNLLSTAYDIYKNYHLKSNSPGKNAGTDGQDIGLYGGSFHWKEGGIPFNPHFQYKKIDGKTNSNGTLPVQIKVKAQDN